LTSLSADSQNARRSRDTLHPNSTNVLEEIKAYVVDTMVQMSQETTLRRQNICAHALKMCVSEKIITNGEVCGRECDKLKKRVCY
jgi:hypothetical protein